MALDIRMVERLAHVAKIKRAEAEEAKADLAAAQADLDSFQKVVAEAKAKKEAALTRARTDRSNQTPPRAHWGDAERLERLHRKPKSVRGNMKNELVDRILTDLTMLIVHHAGLTAAEQYNPHLTPDESDEFIEAHQHWVRTLRRLRQEFEDLTTGIIPEDNPNTELKKALSDLGKKIGGVSIRPPDESPF